MPQLSGLTTRTSGTKVTAASFNTDFGTIQTWANSSAVLVDVARTISVTHTYTATQTFSAGATFGAATTVSTGGLTVTAGGITVSAGGITVTGNSTVTGNLNVTGTLTAGTFTVPASGVTAGTFGAGAYTFPSTLTINGLATAAAGLVVSGKSARSSRVTETISQNYSVNFDNANHYRITLGQTGLTLTLSGLINAQAGTVVTLEVVQDASGSRSYTLAAASGFSLVWAGGVVPPKTTTAYHKDIYTFFFDGTSYCGAQFGSGFNSAN